MGEFTYPNGATPTGQALLSHRWYYPRAFYLGLEPDGSLLVVTRWLEEEGGVNRSVWDWYSKEGELLRRIDVPVGYEVFHRTRDGDYLAKRISEFDEDVVVRLRLR